MPKQNPSEMPLHGDRAVKLDEVDAVYAVYLGRRPDDPDRRVDWLGLNLSDLIGAFVKSPEFIDIHKALVRDGTLVDREALSASDLAAADRWLSSVAAGHHPSPRVAWGDLLLAAITSPDLVALADPGVGADALAVLGRDVEARRGAQASLLALTTFDPDRFLSLPAHRHYKDDTGALDFSIGLPRTGPAPALLPLFTDGLSALRRPGPLTLGDWLGDTQAAALEGLLTHWLWDESTYLRNRSASDRDLDPPEQDSPYLDFLLLGDAAGVSPHPLFCRHAYRVLNGREGVMGLPDFRHFVEIGEAEGLRTSTLFDPDFYIARQPHVRDQVAAGQYGSALEHFVRVGLSAGYAFSPDFDRDHYLSLYADVAEEVAAGRLPSAEWHYVFHGVREGRAPNPFFDPRYYADRYPFVGEDMLRLGIATTIEHFLLVGRTRGWRANQPPAERPVALADGKALFEKRARRALGEIMDGAIAIPDTEAPRLSVIVPVSNQADHTAGLLKSAAFAAEMLKSRRGLETEIVVVDNGSTDHTQSLLGAVPAVRVERFPAAMGFPAAVNAGARIARGDILLIVNNDIEFAPDAFDRVVAVLDSEPSVGIVGAKIVLPNETLQEVGAMLDRLGSSHGHGRGVDASDVRGDRRVEVDYASGCFMAFRRADFEALSGFDEIFSPGYFEDVDFSLRMKRDLQKVTMVDAGLTVTHFEHASFAKGRPPGVNTALILRNRLRLKTAHAALFKGLEDGRPRQRARRARQALIGAARILVVEDTIPAGRLGSGFARQEMILDAFGDMGVAFDIVAMNPTARIDTYKDPRARIFRAWMPGQSLPEMLRHHAGDYSHLWICRTHNLTGHAGAVARAKADFDLRVICDIEALSSQETFGRLRLNQRPAADEMALSAVADELEHTLEVDLWVAIDRHDRALIEQVGLGPVIEIGHEARPRQDIARASFADRDRILFVGSVPDQASAAHDGLTWILSEVWPRLVGMEGARLTIAGAWADGLTEPIVQRFGDRIEMMGEVDDTQLSRLYDQSRVAVAPDRFAAGRSRKVAEAILAGVPTVMSDHVADRLGLAGIPAIAKGRRDDDGRSFAEWLNRLYTDEDVWRSQIEVQNAEIAAKFEPGALADRLRAALEGDDQAIG